MVTVNLHPDRQRLGALTCRTVQNARSVLQSMGWTGTVTLGNADGSDTLDINAVSAYDGQTILGVNGPGMDGDFCSPPDTTGALHIVSRAEACTTQPSTGSGVQWVACENLFCLSFTGGPETIAGAYVYSGTAQWPTSSGAWNSANGGIVVISASSTGSWSPKLVASAGTTYRWTFDNENLFSGITYYCSFYNAADTLLSAVELHSSASTSGYETVTADATAPSGTAYMIFSADGSASYDNVCLAVVE